MPSPVKVKGQYSTLASDFATSHYSRQPSPLAGSGYTTPEAESSSMLHQPPESGQHSPALDSSCSELGLIPSSRARPPVAYDAFSQSSYRHSRLSTAGLSDASTIGIPNELPAGTQIYGWSARDIEADDAMHTPDPVLDARSERKVALFSVRGWVNLSTIVILVAGLVTLFAAYPIISFYAHPRPKTSGFNLGGINSSGQVPVLPGLFQLIDPTTPQSALTKTGVNGKQYNLVFSDEFNTDGRTFYPGDDPYWEAVDLNYWPTGDIEWYAPDAITTKDGKLQITITEQLNHDLNFRSGMLQSWNKFCFTTGILEASISLPGSGDTPGFWPGFWTMGNLGRAGYGATTDGTWPYSYDACDAGALPNQTNPGGNTPVAATNTGTDSATNFELSFLPGQRVGACTCPNVNVPNDHPGPTASKARGAPEIDVIEAQIDVVNRVGQASQSFQIAPFNQLYQYDNSSSAVTIVNPAISQFNSFKGSVTQEAVSVLTQLDNANYGGNGYQTYGFEWFSNPSNRPSGYISWYVGDSTTWTMHSSAVAGDPALDMSARLVPEEAMSIVMNLGMSPGFQHADFKNLKFPSTMFIDYVRVYQLPGTVDGVTCDPQAYPTADYIQAHMNAYSNPNLTTWQQAGYQYPKNSKLTQC